MVQRGVHSEICEAAGWSSPSTFVRFYNLTNLAILWVHLTNIVQASPSLGLFILYGRQVSTYGMTPRPQMALWLSLCLVYSVDSPGSYPHVSLGFESFHLITRPNTCSHTSLFDAIQVKYRLIDYIVSHRLARRHRAIGSIGSFLVLHEPMDVQLYCVIKKGFSWRGKKYFFPYKHLQRSTLSISQGTDVTIVTEYAFLICRCFFYLQCIELSQPP